MAAGHPEESAAAYVLLAEGALVTAGPLRETPEPAQEAGRAAARLLTAAAVT
ncbi:hypothetical protein [Streptomyces sp. NBC_01185]|uniref:hypothetical protein n=1 Tax=Streptomyces sp. NBC_01185 TaxID=2903764 RepID=UPI003865BF0D|nr:hypothetical protein OG770_35565 [Streptomyces sp. NBC_01185]